VPPRRPQLCLLGYAMKSSASFASVQRRVPPLSVSDRSNRQTDLTTGRLYPGDLMISGNTSKCATFGAESVV